MKQLIIVICFTCCFLSSCQLSSPPKSLKNKSTKFNDPANTISESILEQEFSVKQLGFRIGHNYIWPNVRVLREQTAEFENTLAQYCNALNSNSLDVNQFHMLQVQFKKLVQQYFLATSIRLGPVLENNNAFLVNTHSYPFLNLCGIDRNVANFASNQDPGRMLFTQKGLGALDYLLFNSTDLNHHCSGQINSALIAWNNLSDLKKKAFRCNWAKSILSEFKKEVESLYTRWDPSQGNYVQSLLSPSIFKSDKDFLEQLVAALYFIEAIKDDRLGRPLGIYGECKSDSHSCPQFIEFVSSELGLESIHSSLKSLSYILFGTTEPSSASKGFTTVLIQAGFNKIHYDISHHLSRAFLSIDLLKAKGSFNYHRKISLASGRCNSATYNDLSNICGLFYEVTALSRLIKSDVLLALSLRAPPQHQGDND